MCVVDSIQFVGDPASHPVNHTSKATGLSFLIIRMIKISPSFISLYGPVLPNPYIVDPT